MATLSLKNINKVYDNNVQAVFDFNLEIKDKEFIVFVGPSGCGKSTTLRMVAGLEEITSGELYIDGELMNEVLPKNRDIAMVFQNYALYPHMTVFENMSFGLKLKKYPKEEIARRVQNAAEILGITEYLKRKPKALSGGQRQRVALGRAIVREPKIFLMDEPLSNLDAKLRVQMRSEIIKIHQQVQATTIYVTHDQTEAMTMADRVVIMKDGYIQQIGTPKEVFNNPANLFVATFIGAPATNVLNATYCGNSFVLSDGTKIEISKEFQKKHDGYYENKLVQLGKDKGEALFDIEDIKKDLHNNGQKLSKKLEKEYTLELKEKEEELESIIKNIELTKEILAGKEHLVKLGIRPEDITISEKVANSIEMKCDICELLGRESIIHGYVGKEKLIVKTSANIDIRQNDIFHCLFTPDKIMLFDVDKGNRIL